jgi:hypothetical protein
MLTIYQDQKSLQHSNGTEKHLHKRRAVDERSSAPLVGAQKKRRSI